MAVIGATMGSLRKLPALLKLSAVRWTFVYWDKARQVDHMQVASQWQTSRWHEFCCNIERP